MKRRTLDLVFSVGGLALAVLLLVLGLVLKNQADFAKDYVHDQMAQQAITFTPEQGLSPDEKKATCLVSNAGKDLLTGKQAECYANEYIARHLREVNDGKTYSQTSNENRELGGKLEAAMKADPESAATKELQTQVDTVDAKVQTLFRGEVLFVVVDDDVGTQLAAECGLLSGADRDGDAGSEGLAQLYGHRADAAAPTVDEQSLAVAELAHHEHV